MYSFLIARRAAVFAAAIALTFSARAWSASVSSPGDKGEGVAFQRLSALQRGVNLSGWYGGWGDYSPEHLATWTTPADLQFIHSIGLTYVRLPVSPMLLTTNGFDSPESMAALTRLDQSVDDILAAGLNVSITVFPKSDYKQALLTPEGAEAFRALWKFLAAHYASRDPERVFYEILNEPEIRDADQWNALQASVAETIRTVDTQHTLIATGAKYSGIDELLELKLLHDPNVIYTFHFYEPFPFTHQGATWSSPAYVHLRNVPYPGDPAKVGPMVASATDPAAREALAGYASEGWDESVILHRIAQARNWANKHHVPVICNEFGAFRDTISVDPRARYLHDVRTSLESLHIPWAEWDYRGNFGIVVHGPNGIIEPDVPIIAALGLSLTPTLGLTPAPPAVGTVAATLPVAPAHAEPAANTPPASVTDPPLANPKPPVPQ